MFSVLIDWTTSTNAYIFDTAKSLLNDLSPLMWLVVVVGVAILIFWAIVRPFSH
jgi:hypothetical protein